MWWLSPETISLAPHLRGRMTWPRRAGLAHFLWRGGQSIGALGEPYGLRGKDATRRDSARAASRHTHPQSGVSGRQQAPWRVTQIWILAFMCRELSFVWILFTFSIISRYQTIRLKSWVQQIRRWVGFALWVADAYNRERGRAGSEDQAELGSNSAMVTSW